jgi:epoxyqueuosine reductase
MLSLQQMAKDLTDLLIDKNLKKFGIGEWGYTENPLAESYDQFIAWIRRQNHLPLNYMADHRAEIRKDLKMFFPEFKSALVFTFPYHDKKIALDEWYRQKENRQAEVNKISGYVFGFDGFDYHITLRDRLNEIKDSLAKILPGVEIRHSLDIHPVLERDLAYKSGIGWFGKNSMLISLTKGSYFIIGALLLSEKLPIAPKKDRIKDHCMGCHKCIDACPTNAIRNDRSIITDRCISTFTIELFKDNHDIPTGMKDSGNRIFGCDICQEVCPWNRRLKRELNPEQIENDLMKWEENKLIKYFDRPNKTILSELSDMSNRAYRKKFAYTPLERTGRKGMMKNLKVFIK